MAGVFEPIEPAWVGNRPDVKGGDLLRLMRQERGMTLDEVAGRMADAGYRIDASHLQRIETGWFRRSKQTTVDAILTAGLDAPFRLRGEVLAAFGYRLPWTLPTEDEVTEGIHFARHELGGATWPAYVHDYGLRLWHWNRYVPRLLGLPPDDPAPARFVGMSMVDVVFDPQLGIAQVIANAEEYRPVFLRMVKVQTQTHAAEPWVGDVIDRAHGLPGFTEIWRTLEDESTAMMRDQPDVPIVFAVPGIARPLTFRLTSVFLSIDPRFQVAHWIPFGSETMAVVARWAEEDGTR